MLTFKKFLLEGTYEVGVIKDYLSSFTPLNNIIVTKDSGGITIKVDGDIDSSLKHIDKSLEGIGYEIDTADNKEGYAEYSCVPMKDD